MNRIQNDGVLAVLAILAFLTVADAESREVFCENLAELEAHMTAALAADSGDTTTNYKCVCSELDTSTKSFTVDCSYKEVIEEVIEGNITAVDHVDSEQIVFELKQGKYVPSKIMWPNEDLVDIPEAIFYVENGAITSCKFNACTSCRICDDMKSIKVNCAVDPSLTSPRHLGRENYTFACSDEVIASFSMSYDFGLITEDEGGDEDETSPEVTSNNGSLSREEFCQRLTALESHMDERFEQMYEEWELASSHNCICTDLDNVEKSFAVDCSMKGKLASGGRFAYSERMIFELRQEAKYEQITSSWKIDNYEQVFNLDPSGVVTRCEAKYCYEYFTDCIIETNHTSESECSREEYDHPYALSFDFGEIKEEESSSNKEETPPDREEFCQRLAVLESYMDKSFEEMLELTFTSSHECICTDLDKAEKTFAVDCSMEGTFRGSVYRFQYSERMAFELQRGQYEPAMASWKLVDYHPLQEASQEVFFLDDGGVVTRCEESNMCSVNLTECFSEDNHTSEYWCSKEWREHPFVLSFDFGEIKESSSGHLSKEPDQDLSDQPEPGSVDSGGIKELSSGGHSAKERNQDLPDQPKPSFGCNQNPPCRTSFCKLLLAILLTAQIVS